MHVEVSSTNFVTGQKVLALEYAGEPTELRSEDGALLVPGQGGGGLNDMTSSLGSIAAKLNQIPFEDIGKNVDRTLRSVNDVVNRPKLQTALSELSATLQEVRQLAHDANAGMGPVLARLPQVADIALYAYTHFADQGGFELARYPSVQSWLSRCAAQPGHAPLTAG